jgi:hypothetical protein
LQLDKGIGNKKLLDKNQKQKGLSHRFFIATDYNSIYHFSKSEIERIQ